MTLQLYHQILILNSKSCPGTSTLYRWKLKIEENGRSFFFFFFLNTKNGQKIKKQKDKKKKLTIAGGKIFYCSSQREKDCQMLCLLNQAQHRVHE